MQEMIYQEETWEELLNGTVIAMSPRPAVNHNRVAGRIYTVFENYLWGKKCVPFGDGTDLYLSEKDRFVPDGMIVCDEDKVKTDGVYGAPDLVVEILSPSTARNDRGYKKDRYEEYGVPEYWIVSPNDRSIEVYLLQEGRYKLDNTYQLYPDFMLEKMEQAEREALVTEFKCHLYDDLTISLDYIFKGIGIVR